MESVRAIHVNEKRDENDPSGNTFILEFGAGSTSATDEIELQVTLNNIIHHLANLKDNLKNQFRANGLQESEVEIKINSDRNLQLIADLANQEKHGYPLTRIRRTGLDPVVTNIRHELMVPLAIGESNIFTDSVIVMDADIHDASGSFVTTLRKMIEGAIETWEDFCLTFLPDESKDIIDRRIAEKEQEDWANAINSRLEFVNTTVENESNWHLCPVALLQVGLMISIYDKPRGPRLWRGFITAIWGNGNTLIRVRDPMNGMNSDYDTENHIFERLIPPNPNDFQLISDHFLDVVKFRNSILGHD
jgi:hypothetical protein